MTSGNLFRKILVYSLPIILSGELQLLYNAADLVVCGRFGSEHSVGAISATGSLINLIIQLFMGLSVGANVLMARCYGSNQAAKGQRVVYTSMIMSVVIGVVLGAFGAGCARYFLQWMKTPAEVIDLSGKYLTIYFCGLPFSLVYNFGASLLRAVGDTKRPFYYLSIAGVVNVLFNLLFVIVFHMDVAGVALGTILSQAISAVCVVVCLMRYKGFFHFSFKELRFYKQEAIEIARIGLPAGLQGSIFSLSNVLIQSSVNSLGPYAMDGNGASVSIEGFVYTGMNATAQAGQCFISANYGARNWRNIKRCIGYTLFYVCLFGLVLGGVAAALGRPLLSIYVSHPQSMDVGYKRLLLICLTYFICGIMDTLAYSLRGIGYSFLPALVSLCGACGLRVLWVFAVFPLPAYHNLQWLAASYPISWAITSLVHAIMLLIFYRRRQAQYPTTYQPDDLPLIEN